MLSPQPAHRWQPSVVVPMVLAFVLLAVGCSRGSRTTSDADAGEVGTSDQTAEFCGALDAAFRVEPAGSDTDDAFDAALDLAPAELTATVEGIRSANEDDPSEQDMSHIQDLWTWMSDNCRPDGAIVRHIAPPTAPAEFVSCGDSVAFPIESTPTPEGSMVIYGDTSLDDPYQGSVISVVTGLGMGPGDAPSSDVTVRGAPAVTGPAGFFQGGGGPASTRVVVWEVDGVEVSIVGRGFDEARAEELVGIAERVEFIDGAATLPGTTYDPIYSGSLMPLLATVPFLPWNADYAVNYHLPKGPDDIGILTVNGLTMTASEFGATRAFLAESELRSFHGREGFIADGWSANGPYVAAWHEPDDLVVWVAGLSITKGQTIAAAEASIELTPEQWKDTTRFSPECGS